MKTISTNIKNNYIYYAILFFSLSICLPPFFKALSTLILGLSIIINLIRSGITREEILSKNPLYALPILFFIIYCLGLINTQNTEQGIRDLIIKLPLIILPVFFIFIPRSYLSKNKLWHYSMGYILGLVFLIINLLILGILECIETSSDLLYNLSYTRLSSKNHPTYLSLYSVIGLILTYKIPFGEILKTRYNNLIKISLISFLSITTILINSRTGLICLIIIYIWIIIDNLIKTRSIKNTIILVIISIITVFGISNIGVLNQRVEDVEKTLVNSERINPKTSSLSQRKFIYLNIHKLILKNPIIGVGIGDVKEELESFYESNNVYFGNYLNAHNQFFQTTLSVGILGLIILILLFILPFIQGRDQGFILMILIVLGINFMFESMLERQMGVHCFIYIYIIILEFLSRNKELIKNT